MKRCFFRFTFFLIVSCIAFAAKPATVATPVHQRVSDAEVERNIRVKLAKSKIGKDGFSVRVHNGVATWEGSTNVMQHKGAATRMAKTAGAQQVVNNIKVSDAARAKSGFGSPPRKVSVTAAN